MHCFRQLRKTFPPRKFQAAILFSLIAIFLGPWAATLAQEKPPEKPALEKPAQESPAPANPAKPNPQQEKPDESARTPLRIVWVGDIVMEVAWRQPAVPPQLLFDGVRDLLRTYDLVIGNLESPLTSFPDPTPHKDKAAIESGRDVIIRVRSPGAAQALHDGGIQVAALANNHTMDYTEEGLLDTFARLRAAGVLFAGAGKNLAEAEAPLIIEKKGRRIGILSFSDVVPKYAWAEPDRPGIATAKETAPLLAAVRRARPQVDILIVVLHWGVQFDREPSDRQKSLALEAQRAGADLILGAHPHVLQGVGCLGRVPVVYSAGNFLFPTSSLPTRRSAIFEFDFPARVSNAAEPAPIAQAPPVAEAPAAQALPVTQAAPVVRLVPVLIDERGAPQLARDDVRADILTDMAQLSSPLGLRLDGGAGTCSSAPAPAGA
ncbi:MAG TPA: CapA family protein, partial [Candidatus Acidoferrales bacterium]|nr:CapA family protein [Candidatus Acidoferrales bacterium]